MTMQLRTLDKSTLGLLVTAALLAGPPPSATAEDVCNQEASRVVAVGDVHGAYDNFVETLRLAGLVDEGAHWVGGTTHLVQTGDVLDRGEDALEVIDLLMRLEKDAKKAGGRVHALLGNHEVMNLTGDLRYVNPIEYQRFRTADSLRRVQRVYERETDQARTRARAAGEEFDADAYRADFAERIPLGYVERARAFTADGRYGRWLRRRPAIARVNGVVFLHGGLTPQTAALGCKAINDTVRREITKDFDKTRKDPVATLSSGPNGPLWYRGLAREDETAFAPFLDLILERMEARAIVVAHTVTTTGRVQDRFDGRVIMIDVGMAPSYHDSLAALEIAPDGVISALYPGSRAVISMPPGAEPAAATGEASVAAQP